MKKKGVWIALVAAMVGSISLTCLATGMQQETQETQLQGEAYGALQDGETIDLSGFCNDVTKSLEFAEFMKGLDENTQKTLVIPEGETLVLNHYFTIPSNTTLQGGAIEFTADAQYADVYNEAFIINRHSETSWDEEDKNIKIQDVDIRYDCSSKGRSLLRFRNMTGLVITDCNLQIVNQQKSTTSHNAAIDLFKGCTNVEISNNQIYLDNPNGSAGGAIWIRSMVAGDNDSALLKTSNVLVSGNVITSNSCDELLAVGSSGYDTSDVVVSNNTFVRLDGSKKNLMLGVCPAIGGNISNVKIKDNKFHMNNTTAVMNKEILRIGGVLDTNNYSFTLTGMEVTGNEITGNLAGSRGIVVKSEETNNASVLIQGNRVVNTGTSSEDSYGIIATGPNVLGGNVIEGVMTSYSTDDKTIWNDSEGGNGGTASNENVVKIFNTVQEMKAYNYAGGELKEGVYVRTAGYYVNGDAGGALYQISKNSKKTADERKVIELNNGFRAVMIIENNTINVKQYGAKGDGTVDDRDAVYAAITSGAKTVVFKKGEYKIDDQLFFWNLEGVTIEGNHSVLFTDDDYRKEKDYQEHFITFSGSNTEKKSKNITIRNLNVETREILKTASDQKYKTQWGFKYIDQVLLEGCEFTIPDTVISQMESKKFEYSILDFYVDWSNVTVRNCRLIDKAGAWYGGCVGFRDIWNGGSENAEFYNNYLYSDCKDEIIAIFSQGATTSHVNNVDIHDNEIIADRCEFVRDICITVGYDTSNQCDNIQIHDNKITSTVDWACFTLGKTLTNSQIYNNEIIMKSQNPGDGKALTGVVRAAAYTSDSSEVFDNSITIESYEGIGMDVIFDGNCKYYHNTVVSKEPLNRVFSRDCYAVKNHITVNGDVAEIGYNVAYVKDNDIDIKGNLTKVGFNYYGSTWGKDCQILENQITIEGEKLASSFIHLNVVTLNGNSFVFQDNVVKTPNCTEGKKLIWINLLDTTPQTIYLAGNEMGIYQGESYDNKKVEHLISYERKEEEVPPEENTTEENTTEEGTTEEGTTEEGTTEENTTEEITTESSEEITTMEIKSEEKPGEGISTKKEATEEKNQSTSQQTGPEEPKKNQNQSQTSNSATSSSTQRIPFQTQDTVRDPFTVADTGKTVDTKNESDDTKTSSDVTVEADKSTSIKNNQDTYAEQNSNQSEESDKAAEEISQDRSKIEEIQNSTKIEDTGNSKDYNTKNNKTLLIFGMIIVAALVGGILILWNYFKK